MGKAHMEDNLERCRALLRDFPRIITTQQKLHGRLDTFDVYATPGGMVCVHTIHTVARMKESVLESFNVFGDLSRTTNSMDNLLAEIKDFVQRSQSFREVEYTPVDPKVEYQVYDRHDVIVAICAHQRDADLLARVRGYGHSSDSSRYRGTWKVGEDQHKLFNAQDRSECQLGLKNQHAVR